MNRSYRRAAVGFTLLVASVAVAGWLSAAAPARHFVNCSRYNEDSLERQMNFRAETLLRQCTHATWEAQARSPFSSLDRLVPAPNVYGGTDRNVITGGEGTYPSVTQSESQVWGEGSTIVQAYNDSRTAPGCYAGGSYSLDSGTTWTNLNARPFCSGHGTNFGDPTVVYSVQDSRWITGWLATGCGGQGIGLWTSTNGSTWAVGACAHTGTNDDRESMWVDNSASSAFFGRTYISWQDFAVGAGAIRVIFSDDGGTTWSAPVNVTTGATFIRNVEITTAPNGNVFIAGLNEGGGGFAARTNIVYRSINGGATWAAITAGAAFPAAGAASCTSYFVGMFAGGYFRHMGGGDIGAGPSNVIHLTWTQDGAGADVGDIYYTRSTDNGSTWSAPLKIDGDVSTSRVQWMPSLAATPGGQVFISWYDARNTTGTNYERWGRMSRDNGVTWEAPQVMSDVVSPLPLQPDGDVNSCYAGDYERSHGVNGTFHVPWMDGRVLISGNSQQDEFYDKVPTGPICDDFSDPSTQCTIFDPPLVGATVGDNSAATGETGEPNHAAASLPLNSIWYDYTPPADRLVTFDTCTAGAYDTTLAAYTGSTVGALTQLAANDDYGANCGFLGGIRGSRITFLARAGITYHIAVDGFLGAVGTYTLSWRARPYADEPGSYAIAQSAGAIEPGVTNVGLACDDCTTTVTPPFPVRIYDGTYSSLTVSSNGNVQIGTNTGSYNFGNFCFFVPDFNRMVAPHLDDLHVGGAGEGIFTATTGVTPNRRFIIEWRAHYFSGSPTANFEVIFRESGTTHFEMQYGTLSETGSSAQVGAQSAGSFSQYECNTAGSLPSGRHLNYVYTP